MHDANLLEDQPIAWTPSPEVIERAQLTRFMKQVGVSTWDELYAYSINDVEKFTEEVLKFLDIKFDPPYEKLLDTSEGVEFPNWFGRGEKRSEDTLVLMDAASASRKPAITNQAAEDSSLEDKSVLAPAGLNITKMCLDRWQKRGMKNKPALIWEGEEGGTRILTYKMLFDAVRQCAVELSEAGIEKGDAVGLHMPMVVETIVALLAINRLGAIAVPVFSGYGIDAISSRLQAVNAKALFTCDGFPRRGKFFDAVEIAASAVKNCNSIETVFVSKHFRGYDKHPPELKLICGTGIISAAQERRERLEGLFESKRVISWAVNTDDTSPFNALSALFQTAYAGGKDDCVYPTLAEDPLIILYTSGTTGKPKGIAHTHASFPIKAAQDMAFGTDVCKGTRICWYTDIGWMMGPWLIYGALINGATICIYDGAPDYPTPDRMWEFCAKHKVEILGISPTLIRALAAHEKRSEDTPVLMDAKRSEDTPVLMGAASASRKSFGGGTADEDKSVLAPNSERKGWSRHGKLPHFDGEVTQFITFRLADSLPQSVLDRLHQQLEHDKLDDSSEEFRQLVEDYLDSGAGECILRDTKIAEIVRETILYEDGKSCDLKAWVIMPNHGHLLLRFYPGHDLAGLMKRIKGISARKINQLRNSSGTVWQADYFDRYIRDGVHFSKVFAYIENNPVYAKLSETPEGFRFSSAFRRSEDIPVLMDAASASRKTFKRSEDTPVLMDAASASRKTFGGGTADEDKSVLAPFERHDLSSLRALASTGEPWNPAPWWWLFEKVGDSKLPIINYSGGTEIAGGILMGNPLLPIKPCSFPAPCPGMDVDILDEDGKPVEPGKVGELVIKQPWIGMARGFWQEKERYLETYWSRFKNIWVHGDWAMRDKDGHWFILGRSDDTLKVAGKRVGSAEVESLLVAHPLVTEAAVIGVPDEMKGTAMVAFVVRSEDTLVLKDAASASRKTFGGGTADEDKSVLAPLEAELKALVAKDMGKPLAPSKIHFVSALPKTRNAKVMRRVIRSAYLGEDPGDLSALENPAAVEEIKECGQR